MIEITESWDDINVSLKFGDIDNNESEVSFVYIVSGTEDDKEAVRAAFEYAPERWGEDEVNGISGIPKKTAKISSRCSQTVWKVSVEYAHTVGGSFSTEREETRRSLSIVRDRQDKQTNDVSFQSSGVSSHMVNAIFGQRLVFQHPNIPLYTPPDTIPIGWNGRYGSEMAAAGADCVEAQSVERYTRIMDYDKVRSIAWRRTVVQCTGAINLNTFKGWEKGEAMFMGCSYDTPQRGVNKVKVTFEFSIRLNDAAFVVAGTDLGFKYGHEMAWGIQRSQITGNDFDSGFACFFFTLLGPFVDFSRLGI